MKVYVVESGVYSGRSVHGIYDSPERAIAACTQPGWKWYRHEWTSGGRVFVSWNNDQDWDDARYIAPYELVTEGPLQSPDQVRREPE